MCVWLCFVGEKESHSRCHTRTFSNLCFLPFALPARVFPQFYSWYFHTIPFLLWQTNFPVAVRLAVLCGVEIGFNVFPATPVSSGMLQVSRFEHALGSRGCHGVVMKQ